MIVFLNGPSSVGKTTIAKELQRLLREPFLCVGVDQFYMMMPERYFGVDPREEDPASQGFRWRTMTSQGVKCFALTPGPVGYSMLTGMHRAVAAIASAGNNLIVDENLIYKGQLDDYLHVLTGLAVLLVGVRCSLEEVEKREAIRGDRRRGHARGHYHLSHAIIDNNGGYDFDIDTSNATAAECAKRINEWLLGVPVPMAFNRLRDRLVYMV